LGQYKLPLVTAVVPVYNHEKYVVESIRSIIGQSYPNVELIVINDGSKDRSHEMVLTLVEECKQRFARFEYINRENRGLSATLNQALELSQGKYLGALASDDIILSDKFTCLVEALESREDSYAAAFGNAGFIGDQGQEIHLDTEGRTHLAKSDKTYSTYLDFYTREINDRALRVGSGFSGSVPAGKIEFGTYRTLLAGCYLPAMSSLLKTAIVREVGGWTPGNVSEDWEMWLKLSKRYKLLFVDKTVALYRLHGSNSRDTMRQQLQYAFIPLLAREREYCSQNGLTREWKDVFYGSLYWVLRYGNSPIKEKVQQLRTLQLSDVSSLSAFLARAGYKKLFRRESPA
jgi:alpha-1,3-rhamnosyltransferase